MPFPGALARSETQTASSKIWTPVAESISYHDNFYAKQTSITIALMKWKKKIEHFVAIP